ncbi:MAG: hypothetical protein ABI036_13645 [Fibrobacteria bacterium]
MRDDMDRPVPSISPLVGNVEKSEASPKAYERDEDILLMLRRKLQQRNSEATQGAAAKRRGPAGEEDKYEPQRLNRKICWQYDINAKKIPLLRRHYI